MERSKVETTPLWLQQLLQECENENQNWPIKLLGSEGRKVVWALSAHLGANSKGIPAQACRLLERYLSIRISEAEPIRYNPEERARFKQELSSKLTLIMVSCVQLSSKMCCAATALNPKILEVVLMREGVLCPAKELNRTEMEVFAKLGYRIPLFTSQDAAEMLAVEVGLPTFALGEIGMLVNIAEYHRDLLEQKVRDTVKLPASTTFGSYWLDSSTIRTLHLAAGAVAAGARHFGHSGLKPLARLATLTRAPTVYIKAIATVIFIDLLLDEPNEAVPCKKRRVTEGS